MPAIVDAAFSKCYILISYERTPTLGYINITLFILLGVKASVGWEIQTHGERQRQTAIWTHNFFSWPYHAVLFSRSHLVLLLLLDRGYSTGTLHVACCTSGALSVIASWHWHKTHTDSNCLWPSHWHLHISFHHTHDFRSTVREPSPVIAVYILTRRAMFSLSGKLVGHFSVVK